MHTNPKMLGKQTQQALQNANAVFYSPLSVFEFAQKLASKKTSAKDLINASTAVGLQQLPLTVEGALETLRFGSLRKRDPMDLLLLSQASAQRLHFYTADQVLLDLDLDFVKNAEL
jgi:PIN domain nuclease of toxin-antitoxin system